MRRRFAALVGVAALAATAVLVVGAPAGGAAGRTAPAPGCTGASDWSERVTSAGRAGAGGATTRTLSGKASSDVHLVSGYSVLDQMTGDLVGTWTWTEAGWDSFFATLRYDQAAGLMTFRVPEIFVGTVAGRSGTLSFDGFFVQRFKPGTPLYDFSGWPNDQPGTTGDPAQWLSGWCLHRITDATGGLEGASGLLYFRDITVLYDANYWGVIRL
jgi:hypothetical protein